jgi:hypothetical protein
MEGDKMKTKTIKDFEKLKNQTMDSFIKEKMDFNRPFKEKTESFEEIKVYTVVNHVHSVVIKFDEETGHIVQREIYNSDLPNINTMLNDLKGETEWNS